MKLRKRKVSSHHFYASNKGKRYSVVDFSGVMSTVPNIESLREMGMFLGWEAAEIKNGKIDFETLYRADTWEELQKQL